MKIKKLIVHLATLVLLSSIPNPVLAEGAYLPNCINSSDSKVKSKFIKRLADSSVLCRIYPDEGIYLVLPSGSLIFLNYLLGDKKVITIYHRANHLLMGKVTFILAGRKFSKWDGEANTEIVEMYRPEIKILLDYPEYPQGEF